MQSLPTTNTTYGTFIQVYGTREDSAAILRHAIDAVRREWTLEPDIEQPLGVYFKGEELVFHDPDGTFDDPPVQSDSDGGSDDPSGTDSAWSDHPCSDTEVTSDDSNDSVDKYGDSHDVSSYEGGPPRSAAYSGTFLQTTLIKDLLKLARAGYTKEFYTIQMIVRQYQRTFKDGVDDTVFNLELDTGSNTTCVYQVCPVIALQ
ncbi:hypothetical protein C8Q73DRAFT_463895 [Cubamyces lactineus]|nr:hypothetical protein C8Q73DRAFT_463895 [Cubamyces lactineus]